jgi:hypothetical protein
MKNGNFRAALLVFGLALAGSAFADPASETPPSPASALAEHLQKVERQAARLERQIAHPRGRPGAAAELELLAAHLERLQPAAASLGPEAGAELEGRRAALLDRLRHGERRHQAPPSAVAGSGSISGTVTAPGGQPLADIPIVAHFAAGGYAESVYTDNAGVYRLDGLADGSYHVATSFTIFDSPYLNETYDDVHCEAYGPCHTELATPVLVAGGAAVGQIDFRLSAGGKLRGRVLDQDGVPVEGATVAAYGSLGQQVAQTVTDVVGRYTLGRMVPGSYYLRATSYRHLDELYPDVPCEGGSCSLPAGVAVAVGLDSQVTGLDFSLQRLNTLRGKVKDAGTAAPIAYADVRVTTADGATFRWLTANFLGEWESADLPAGTYFAFAYGYDYLGELFDGIPCAEECNAASGTPIPLADGASVGGIDFSLLRLGSIAGSLKAADTLEPVAGRVEIFNQGGFYVDSDFGAEFHVRFLDPGSYFVATNLFFGTEFQNEVWQDHPCAAECNVTGGTPVAVALGETADGIEMLLDRFGGIEGRVVASSGGAPLEGIHLSAYQVATGTWVRSATTDQQGFYRLAGLAPGSYKVTADSPLYRSEIFDGIFCAEGSCDPSLGQTIAVALGQTTAGIDFSLERLGFFGGTVRDQASQQPLQGVRVEIYSAGGFWGSYYTDEAGAYTTGGFADGSYFAAVYTSSDSEYLSEIYSGIDCRSCPPASSGTAIPVSVGTSRLDIDFTLVKGGSITGLVVAAGDLASAGGSVIAYDSVGQVVASVSIGGDGSYSLLGLGAGNYFLMADPGSIELATEVWPNLVCQPNAACTPLAGTAVEVELGAATIANFALDRLGRLAGRVIDAETGAPVGGGQVAIHFASDNGYWASSQVDGTGSYQFGGLAPGAYKMRTFGNPRHIERVLGGANCEGDTCNLSAGTGVAVQMGQTAAAPDLPLAFGPGLAGWVRREGSPAALVGIDVWNEDGEHLGTAASDAAGRFRVALDPGGGYYLSTDVGAGFFDELYQNVPCPLGPAYLGLCDPLAGDSLEVPYGEPAAEGILFDLESRTAIFRDGFESGNFGAWSQATGN